MIISIKTKIIGSVVVLYLMLLIVVFVAHHRRNLLVHGMLDLETAVGQLNALIDLQVAMDRFVMPANDYLITGDFDKENSEFQNITSRVEKEFNRIEGLGLDRNFITIIKRAKNKYSILKRKADKIFSIQHPIGNMRGSRLQDELDALANHIISDYLDKIGLLAMKRVNERIAFINIKRKRADIVIFVGTVVSGVMGILFAIYLVRSIINPILELKKGAVIVGNGNLTHRISIRNGLEVNILVEEFNKMTQKLKESYDNLERKIENRTSALNELNEKYKLLSVTDGLTNIYNHRYFYEKLEEEIKRAVRYKKSLSLIMVDIDYFKHYNDTHGHQAGDNVLRDIALLLKKGVRELDIVARYGGEEFCIILPETGKQVAMNLAERIRVSVPAQPFPFKETQPDGNLTISLGVATFPDDAKSSDNLVTAADSALYKAKGNGRNRVEVA